jgi:hypothetical protein
VMRKVSEEISAEAASACMGPATHLSTLKAQLGITQNQSEAWAAYVAAVLSNRQRMEATLGADAPFGALADRLAALMVMRRAGSQLFGCLSTPQRIRAGVLLPLCCQSG